MDRLHLMNVFMAVAEEQGFAAAARRLRLSPPAVTRAVAALEEQLGVKLLNRTTRHVRTTEAGQQYLEDIRHILAELEAADEALAGINAEPRGKLVVTAPVLFGRMYVMPGIIECLQRYPETEVFAMFLDRVVNLLDEGVDVAVRIGELPDSSMRALKVGTIRRVVCASPQYLQHHGVPQTPQELREHTIVASSAGNSADHWRFKTATGTRALQIRPRLMVTTNDAAIEAATQAVGITRLLSYQISPELRANKLQIILEEYEPTPWPIHIVHREGRYASVKVRAFIDLMAERLRSDPTLH